MILWTFSLKEVRRRPGRALLTLLSVVIGVATVVSVFSATRTTRAAYAQMFEKINGRADLEITAGGGARFDESVVETVLETPGVEVAVPLIHRNTILYAENGRAKLTALGIDPEKDSAVREYQLVAGRQLDDGTGVWLDAGLARRLGIELNDEVKLLTRIGLKRSEVIGLVRPTEGSAVVHGGLVFMSLRRAQYRFRIGRKVDAISVILDESADETFVRQSLVKVLPDGLSVDRPATRTDVTDEAMFANEQGLQMATAFMLLLSVIVITNTFSMNVGERRRQFAVMRAIGATRRQIARVVYREALAMGIVGTVLGILVGCLGARLLTVAIGRTMLADLPEVEITTASILFAAVFGLGLALLGAYLPARQAAKLTPVEAMVSVPATGGNAVSHWLPIGGLVVVFTSTVVLAACIGGQLPTDLIVVASVTGLIGLVMLIPVFIGPLSRAVEVVLFRSMSVESRLARRQMLRHRGRTTLTIGVLYVAISTGIAMASTISNNLDDVQKWYRRAIVGDFFVRAMMPDMATGEAADMPEGVGEQIRKISGVVNVDPISFVSARAENDISVLVVVREFESTSQAYFDIKDGDPGELVDRLGEGQVVIGTVLSQRRDLGVGDSIAIETVDGAKRLTIAGVANDYIGGGLTVYMDRPSGEQLLGVVGEDLFVIQCEPSSLRHVESQLDALCNEHGLLLQSYAELVETIDKMMASIIGSLRGLLVLSFVVAGFGLVNTLSMNVLEQTRELGMLRIVAMTRSQVRRVIFAQAAMMGIIGLLPGAAAGLGIAYLTNLSALPVLGHPVVFHLYPKMLIGSLVAAGVVILIAAWIPAERAARLAPADAMRFE